MAPWVLAGLFLCLSAADFVEEKMGCWGCFFSWELFQGARNSCKHSFNTPITYEGFPLCNQLPRILKDCMASTSRCSQYIDIFNSERQGIHESL